ncbi:MAG: DNA translocase FtsK 4TM domain-containing protein, partial [Acidobacteriota bacterium]|nr:DNA translocase FtsK 4TM domain-containing protein [Acidobacteriota bacterium]
MPKKSTRAVRRARTREIGGILLLLLAVIVLMSVISYRDGDGAWFFDDGPSLQGHTANWLGRFGATVGELALQLFGVVSFVLPIPLAWIGWRVIVTSDSQRRSSPKPLTGYLILLALLAVFTDLLFGGFAYRGGQFGTAGGYLGQRVSLILQSILNRPGALLLTGTALLVAFALTTRISLVRSAAVITSYLSARLPVWRRSLVAGITGIAGSWRSGRAAGTPAPRATEPVARATPASPRAPASAERPTITPKSTTVSASTIKPKPVRKPADAPQPVQRALPIDKPTRGYSLPPIELLNEPKEQSREGERELLERAEQITAKFSEFAIDGQVVAIHPGPVVTTFEFKPEAGVKYSKITGMTDDLSLALRAESVRIDRLAGRATIGIEVPNSNQETIFPRELIDADRFRNSPSRLTLALGKDIHGEPFCAELDRMPHLLIAGATGAGKSVGLNGMIISMLFKSTPKDLRFIMIDTKMIELGVYEAIPHLLVPVVTDPKHASTALKWAVREMENRYRRLAAVGLRNIAQFNALLEKEPDRTMDDPKTGEPVPLKHLPYLVVVIDEMADLMMVAASDVEESVMRLAQMARAVGIHLIIATQRPSVDVITGTIKANFPSRIAFRVSQRVDSRTIIDQQGAENLLGRGDMLLLPTGSSRLQRIHSGYIT